MLMSVTMPRGPNLVFDPPLQLFEPPLPTSDALGELGAAAAFGVAPDGDRFLFAVPIEAGSGGTINIVPFNRLSASNDN